MWLVLFVASMGKSFASMYSEFTGVVLYAPIAIPNASLAIVSNGLVFTVELYTIEPYCALYINGRCDYFKQP